MSKRTQRSRAFVFCELLFVIAAVSIGMAFWMPLFGQIERRHPEVTVPLAVWYLGLYGLNWLVVCLLTIWESRPTPRALNAVGDALGGWARLGLCAGTLPAVYAVAMLIRLLVHGNW